MGTITTALIGKIEVFGKNSHTSSQAEIINAVQDSKSQEIASALDARVEEAENYKESLEQQNLPAVEKAARVKEVDAYIKKNREVKATLHAKHPEDKEAVTSGDFVRAK
jgi:hypothetical protein